MGCCGPRGPRGARARYIVFHGADAFGTLPVFAFCKAKTRERVFVIDALVECMHDLTSMKGSRRHSTFVQSPKHPPEGSEGSLSGSERRSHAPDSALTARREAFLSWRRHSFDDSCLSLRTPWIIRSRRVILRGVARSTAVCRRAADTARWCRRQMRSAWRRGCTSAGPSSSRHSRKGQAVKGL